MFSEKNTTTITKIFLPMQEGSSPLHLLISYATEWLYNILQ